MIQANPIPRAAHCTHQWPGDVIRLTTTRNARIARPHEQEFDGTHSFDHGRPLENLTKSRSGSSDQPLSSTCWGNALHEIVPVMATPDLSVASTVNVPPGGAWRERNRARSRERTAVRTFGRADLIGRAAERQAQREQVAALTGGPPERQIRRAGRVAMPRRPVRGRQSKDASMREVGALAWSAVHGSERLPADRATLMVVGGGSGAVARSWIAIHGARATRHANPHPTRVRLRITSSHPER